MKLDIKKNIKICRNITPNIRNAKIFNPILLKIEFKKYAKEVKLP